MHSVRLLVLLVMLGTTPGLSQGNGDFGLRIEWEDNILRISSPRIPTGAVELWYLEAFCRSGSTNRDWSETVIPHETAKLAVGPDGKMLRLKSVVEPGVEVIHEIRAEEDEVRFSVTLTNPTNQKVDIDWAQPCIRVGAFTGLNQEEYIRRCFIFTERALTTLDKTRRTEEALYRGGQVYVPEGINKEDVNPRPLSPDVPVNGLIGCFSHDDKLLLAMAWDSTQELLQGVIACIHADFRIGGLEPGEKKQIHGKLYVMENNPEALLERYRRDFLR